MRVLKLYIIFGVCMMCTPKIYSLPFNRIDFKAVNDFGDTIPYMFTEGDDDAVTISAMNVKEWYKTDSLVIPESVTYNGKQYIVSKSAMMAFSASPEHTKHICLPKTYSGVDEATITFFDYFGLTNSFVNAAFAEIVVAEDNPYLKSVDGVLYSKDGGVLIAFPRMKNMPYVDINEQVKELVDGVFYSNPYIKSLILPNTLKVISSLCFADMPALEELVLKDSVEIIRQTSFGGKIPKLVLGKGVKYVSAGTFWNPETTIYLTCYAPEPPEITPYAPSSNVYVTELEHAESIHLFVPRMSLDAYRQADGWKNCASILSIEPPIVAGVDEMTISWVQNFSATGYVWTLYSDESHTDMVMSLTFNEKGYLTDIVLGSLAPNRAIEANAPSMRMSAADGDDTGDSERRFAEYYSFTIKSLTPETKYYYTRQTLADDEVIDEEQGAFATLPDTGTGMEQHPSLEVPYASNKLIRDGQLQIRCQDKTYSVQGVETK